MTNNKQKKNKRTMASMLADSKPQNKPSQIPVWLLLITVLITGASVLIIELIGTRVLAPFFGSGIYTWSALITVTLAALSLGYILGGKFIDKHPGPDLLFHLCLVAGLWTALTPWLATLLLPNFVQLPDSRLAVITSSVALFAPNLFILGMACPFAIRLLSRDHESSGTTSGLIFSVSTLGSLLGALGAGFILVPHYGVLNILTFCGLSLFFLAASGYVYLKLYTVSIITLTAATLFAYSLLTSSPTQTSSLELLDSSPSFYGQVQVVRKDGYKILLVDGVGQNYVTKTSARETTYINFFSALPLLKETPDKSSQSSLVIGLGAGQLPMLLRNTGMDVEIVEIDPVIDAMARKHFGFDIEKNVVHFVDGRLFLSESSKNYDYIFIDAFNSDQIAWHLLSKEAIETARSRLKSGGLLAINITSITSGEDITSLQATLNSVFPYVRVFDENTDNELTNIVFLASLSPINLNTSNASLTIAQTANINQYLVGELDDLRGGLILTDNFNPVGHQRLAAQLLWRKEMRDFLGTDYYYWTFL